MLYHQSVANTETIATETIQPETAPWDGLRTFTRAFFGAFGASVRAEESCPAGTLHVELPPHLVDHFGRQALHLVFQPGEATGDGELMAHGSQVFDRIMAYLERRGALTVQQLPVRHNGADALLRAVQPRNAAILDLKMEERQRELFVFNWHITYRADDKQEEIYTVLLDEDQRRIPLLDAAAGTDGLHLETLLADAEPPAWERDGNGQPVPPKLPPMTRLTRLAEASRKYALYHADVRCAGHEAQILPRLHKVLSRLTSYYQQQIEEVYDSHDPDGQKRRLLEEDLQRKIQEEVENHRLRVQVRLLSYALLLVPMAVANIRLGAGGSEASLQVTRNRYTGALGRPRCDACGAEITDLILDRNGHLVCEGCTTQCLSCLEVLCDSCGLNECPVCGQDNCDGCSRFCWACGGRACAEHISACPICADPVCHGCQTTCSQCGERQCHSHMRADGVSAEPICGRCAVRCPSCQGYSAHLQTCSASGQRFCRNCTATCHRCERTLGVGFYTVDPVSGHPYCSDCLVSCPTCDAQIVAASDQHCHVCAGACCLHCGQRCRTCGRLFCPAHAVHCDECGACSCAGHLAVCSGGGEALCPGCQESCAICEQVHCQQHSRECLLCLQSYCTTCVQPGGFCATCADLLYHATDVAMAEEPAAADRRVANILHKYRWVRHGNRRYSIYLGESRGGAQAVVIAAGATVLHVRRSSLIPRLLGGGEPWS